MSLRSFSRNDLLQVGDALEIAEDATGNHFKFSLNQWKRHCYDVRTLSSLSEHEIRPNAFALLNKSSGERKKFWEKTSKRDFYMICLQDHSILNALSRDKGVGLMPLLVYIFTHELIHIVRFCSFMNRFEAYERDRDKEEKIVHGKTYEILRRLSLPNMDHVLGLYENHRLSDSAAN